MFFVVLVGFDRGRVVVLGTWTRHKDATLSSIDTFSSVATQLKLLG
jgi:hypothetical protein